LGVSRVEARVSVPAFPAAKNNDSDTDTSYGIGADIGITNDLALNIEYMRYLDESKYDLSAIGLGLTVRF
jgi:opacity protein-like surface antigen